jgi:hypothetical protein
MAQENADAPPHGDNGEQQQQQQQRRRNQENGGEPPQQIAAAAATETTALLSTTSSFLLPETDPDEHSQSPHPPHHHELSFFESVIHRAEEVVEDLMTFEELDMERIDIALEQENMAELNELVPTFQDLTAPDFIQRAASNAGGAAADGGDEMILDETIFEYTAEHIVHPADPFLPHVEKLGFWPLVVLIFYNVSGGPFGVESSVRSAGPLYTILGFIFAPLLWSLQEALITAELGTAFPEASGGVAWVEEAFGANWGWLTGYLGWVAGATDNAIYPVLFMENASDDA